MSKVFMVTVLYTARDGKDTEAVALARAPNAVEAIDAAVDAVRALPHCAKIEGGMCEEVDGGAEGAIARATTPQRPAGATLH